MPAAVISFAGAESLTFILQKESFLPPSRI